MVRRLHQVFGETGQVVLPLGPRRRKTGNGPLDLVLKAHFCAKYLFTILHSLRIFHI